MNKIRDLILRHPVALRCWHSVVEDLVADPAENACVQELLRERKYGHALLETLVLHEATWEGQGCGSARAELISVLREHGLHQLADEIREHSENEGWPLQWEVVPNPDPRRLLKLMLRFAPKISVALLERFYCSDDDDGASDADGEATLDLKRSLLILEATGYVKVQNGVVSVFRTSSQFSTPGPDEELEIIENVRDFLEEELSPAAAAATAPAKAVALRLECVTHAMALLPHLLQFDELILDSWRFLLHAAIQMQTLGDHRTLLTFTEQAAVKLAAGFGERHENTLEMKRRVGEARLMWGASALSAGRTELGREHFGQAVTVLEPLLPVAVEELGESHLVTLLTRDSLARAYNGTGQYDKAMSLASENVRLSTASASASALLCSASELTILLMLTKGIVLFTMGRLSYAIPVLEFVVREGSTTKCGGISVAKGLLTMAYQEIGEKKKQATDLLRSQSQDDSRLGINTKQDRKAKRSTASL